MADRGLAEHSDLGAALRAEGISCDVIAGFHHDHPYVQWDWRMESVKRLADA